MKKLFLLLALLPLASLAQPGTTAKAAFAGGCFWCMESDFEHLDGVLNVISGYTGGKEANPTYEEVSAHRTGHAESVQVTYDPAKVSYAQLVDYFFHHIDPLTANAQFCDHGEQYRSAIFYGSAAERDIAQQALEKFQKQLGQPIVTQIVAAGRFYPAEEYHQDYYKKNPVRYKFYRYNCGRDARVNEVWGEHAPH